MEPTAAQCHQKVNLPSSTVASSSVQERPKTFHIKENQSHKFLPGMAKCRVFGQKSGYFWIFYWVFVDFSGLLYVFLEFSIFKIFILILFEYCAFLCLINENISCLQSLSTL